MVDARGCRWTGPGALLRGLRASDAAVLVDVARARSSLKRGGDCAHGARRSDSISQDERPGSRRVGRGVDRARGDRSEESQVVELRFFGGLTAEETAEVLSLAPDTVLRDWQLAKVWLLQRLEAR